MPIDIIFYSAEKVKFDPPRLDYLNTYSYTSINGELRLIEFLKTKDAALILFLIEELDLKSIALIKMLQKININYKIAHIGANDQAKRAWDTNLFHFDQMPLTELVLQKCYNKYISTLGTLNFISYNDLEGVHTLIVNEIIFIVASGNYSTVYLSSGKKLTISKQIKHFEELLKTDPKFLRINRSWMININKIQKIGAEYIYFVGLADTIKISKETGTKLKKIILNI